MLLVSEQSNTFMKTHCRQTLPYQSMQNRILDIQGTLNFRDLGGYKTNDGRVVHWGRIYRSAQLDRLSEEGIAQTAALGIKTVVDLRFSHETTKYPTIAEAVPEAEMLSWHQAQVADSEKRSKDMQSSWESSLESHDPKRVKEAMRLNYPQKLYSHAAIYREMLLRLAESKTPLLFHCAAGKDRTGVAAALILSLLGVSYQQIIEDYLLTQQQLAGRIEQWMAGGAQGVKNNQDFQSSLKQYSRHVLEPIFSADQSYIMTLLDYVDATYGGFENYAEQRLEFDADSVAALRAQLLD